ncbi:MAG: type I restriction enzyme HsdR N-terminal domain-containing protein, partial [Bacteroidales bacterium]|nr:type I restriction enzyme HsdR N-terminal domain-containing protein [Bacteroidales bacterium]
EASVRSFIIDPLIKELGYTEENIVLEKTVHIQIGSKKQTTPYYADYALKVGHCFVCVIEAKSTDTNITDSGLIDQAFSYASHREIRSNYFVLCNGLELALYKTDLNRSLLLRFHCQECDQHWDDLKRYLSPKNFQTGQSIEYEKQTEPKNSFDISVYCRKRLLNEIPIRRQAVRRHFGVHPYFTKQSWNIVQAYIMNYSQPGDVVLDPFGGSGVTLIESLMLGRKGIHVDINPLANFLVDSLLVPVKIQDMEDAFDSIKTNYLKKEPKTKTEINEALKKYPRPKCLLLPQSSDVKTTDQLFSQQQTAQLGFLKSLIKKVKDKNIRKTLLLMFSGLIHYYNVTSFDGPHGNTGSSAMWVYRYRVAPNPTNLVFSDLLQRRFRSIRNAKQEIISTINDSAIKNAQIVKASATNLSFLKNESVDYIYTDPPYGKNIQYLDLSAMWYAWLDLEVSENDYQLEAIEDGKLDKSREKYKRLIAQSIREMFRVLKYDRWLSFVFAHKDPEFWHLIIDTAESCGFEYVGAVSQKNGSSNYHKRQNPFTVLSGQLIINFRKVHNPKTLMKANLGIDMDEVVIQTVESVITEHNGATLEQINDAMIIKAMELGFLDVLAKEYRDITVFLSNHFNYDKKRDVYYIPQGKPFKSSIPVELRIKYYLTSLLNRNERLGKESHFNNIVLEILLSLKNGITPTHQTILSVLEDIAERVGDDCWKLKKMSEQKEFSWEIPNTV